MEDFQAYCKPAYKCGLCGEEFTNVKDRSACEVACLLKKQEEEKKAAAAKKQEERNARKAEVDAAVVNLQELITAYVKDYGYYEYDDGGDDTNFHWPSRMWHRFW